MAEHAKAFDKGTDEDKLKATSDQYQEQTGQNAEPEAGPDPILEAVEKLDLPQLPEQEPVHNLPLEQETITPENTMDPVEELTVEPEGEPTAGTTTEEAKSAAAKPVQKDSLTATQKKK